MKLEWISKLLDAAYKKAGPLKLPPFLGFEVKIIIPTCELRKRGVGYVLIAGEPISAGDAVYYECWAAMRPDGIWVVPVFKVK